MNGENKRDKGYVSGCTYENLVPNQKQKVRKDFKLVKVSNIKTFFFSVFDVCSVLLPVLSTDVHIPEQCLAHQNHSVNNYWEKKMSKRIVSGWIDQMDGWWCHEEI